VVLGAPIIIDKAEHYEKHLAEQKVVVSQQERRRLIVEGLDARAAELGGEWSDPGDVLAEAVYLAEWPSVARGALADGHLRLPAPVLITAMQSHQRYFPVWDGDGRLLPAFLYVSNADPRAADLVTRGNERVLEGRLDDAEFAYDRDVAEGLDTMAARFRVDAAHDALQHGELDDHLTHEVGLGQPRGHAQRLGERRRRAVAAGVRAFGAGPGGQTGHQPLQAVRLVGQGAELLVEHHVAEAVGHGVEALGDVAVVGKLGVVQPAFEHTLVAARDEIGRPGIGVAHVEERRQQAAVAVPHREVALMALHRRDEHGGRQPQVAVGERAAGNARPLGEVHRLGQHVARVGPLRAEIGGVRVETLNDQAAALLLRDDHLLLRQVLLVVLGPVDDDGRAEHPVTLRHVAGGQAVERRLHRLAPELADQPADGTGEAQVLGLAGGTAAPAHPARDLQARDQSRDETRQDSGRVATLGLDADDGELRAAARWSAAR